MISLEISIKKLSLLYIIKETIGMQPEFSRSAPGRFSPPFKNEAPVGCHQFFLAFRCKF
jgi:hypothetical protein